LAAMKMRFLLLNFFHVKLASSCSEQIQHRKFLLVSRSVVAHTSWNSNHMELQIIIRKYRTLLLSWSPTRTPHQVFLSTATSILYHLAQVVHFIVSYNAWRSSALKLWSHYHQSTLYLFIFVFWSDIRLHKTFYKFFIVEIPLRLAKVWPCVKPCQPCQHSACRL
jgi:hypothetical protein